MRDDIMCKNDNNRQRRGYQALYRQRPPAGVLQQSDRSIRVNQKKEVNSCALRAIMKPKWLKRC